MDVCPWIISSRATFPQSNKMIQGIYARILDDAWIIFKFQLLLIYFYI